ncbi:right-handed parallel beta-helix repeat-containing protein [Halosquirtibacter xylanolyticus]|uniref:right-handed parallel beta-helix repeat-containing protein n=1 Tax=Halosquirtibacter xylanolyticus TaxID=3374599 RepID=UPI0037493CCB|nr:right-handed parallel beta-helix repeat-containing protein [Prolixibacteraceae bacterium]
MSLNTKELNCRAYFLLLFLCVMLIPAIGKGQSTKYVSPTGNDVAGAGTKTNPFKTIKYAINNADSKVGSGDTLFIMGGNYHEELLIENITSSEAAPLVIKNYQNQEVIIDGSVPVEQVADGAWEKHDGEIYRIKLTKDTWQIFVDRKWTMLARWPNGLFSDDQAWNRDNWARGVPKTASIKSEMVGGKSVRTGTEYIDPATAHQLSDLPFDIKGAMGVLNICNFFTYAREITSHKTGDNFFEYDANSYKWIQNVALKPVHHYLFFDSKYEFIDQPGEWYYDPTTKYLYLWAPDGGVPTNVSVRTINTALTIKESSHVKIEGVNFFSAGVYALKTPNVTIENCTFNYPCFNQRTLKKMGEENGIYFNRCDHASVVNCEIAYTDGLATKFLWSKHCKMENCLLHDLDYSAAHHLGNSGFVWFKRSPNAIFRRNEVYRTGPSEGVMIDANTLVELNKIHDIHPLQHDGAMVHMMKGGINNDVRNNWFYNNTKRSIRMQDGARDKLERGQGPGLVRNNVTFNIKEDLSMILKGDEKTVYNNLSLTRIWFADKSKLTPEVSGIHLHSKSANNASNGGIDARGGDHKANWDGAIAGGVSDVKAQVCDWDNFDFRPRLDGDFLDTGLDVSEELKKINPKYKFSFNGFKPDIGAYEWGDENYWIAGRQLKQTSTPIPADKGNTNHTTVDLMWLKGYKSTVTDIYFGNSQASVAAANVSSSSYKGRVDNNMYHPRNLVKGQTYYWRADGVVDGKIVKGEVWSFTAGENANIAKNALSVTVTEVVDAGHVLEGVKVTVANISTYTDILGKGNITNLEDNQYVVSLSKDGYKTKTITLNIHENKVIRESLEKDTSADAHDALVDHSVRIYPIPANDFIHIQVPARGVVYQIISSHGMVVSEGKIIDTFTRADISSLASGSYIMRLKHEDGTSVTKHFLKK